MRLAFAEFFQDASSLNVRRDQHTHQHVDQLRAGQCNLSRIFTGKIKFSSVGVFISCKSTRIADLLNGKWQIQFFDLVVEAFAFFKMNPILLSNMISNSFQANSQESACRSRREMHYRLSFLKYLQDVFRHVLGRFDPLLAWIDHSAIFVKNHSTTAMANATEIFVRGNKFQDFVYWLIVQDRCFVKRVKFLFVRISRQVPDDGKPFQSVWRFTEGTLTRKIFW